MILENGHLTYPRWILRGRATKGDGTCRSEATRKSHTKLIISTVITIAAVWVGFLFVPSLRQADEVTSSSSKY